jgi:tetratricopeptide (TPR) repeat protein
MKAGWPSCAAWPLLALGLAPAAALAACPGAAEPVGRIVAVVGSVTLDGGMVAAGELPREVCAESVVATGPRSRARLYQAAADTLFTLDERTATRLAAPPAAASGLIALLRGGLHFLSQVRRTLTVETPYVSAGVEGTEVLLRVTDAGTELIVYEGDVGLAPGSRGRPVTVAEPRLATGDRLAVDADGRGRIERPAERGYAPLRLAARRELAWTLYYPPIVVDDGTALPTATLEAARLLRSGRVDEARAALARVADGSALAPERDALLALIAVIQGDAAEGRRLAETAVGRAPSAAAPLLALSYAEQALAEIPAAQAAAQAATRVAPDEPLAWARLAETLLMQGRTREAREAAARAVALAPTALARVVDGFAALAAIDIAAAEASFAQALALDSEQPLAQLGRGLALIRRSDLEEGRQALEVAAGLDPTRSLLRSYLGKAYFEERRDEVAGTQYEIAKALDPTDPTPWLYDAIRKQADNRPVEALRDLERSIELNDNRATFRSRLLLDQDRAVRNAGLGWIFQDLGFERLGQRQGTLALAEDPASAAAHRLLEDVYAGQPRLDAARISERFQALMLQPITRNPLQPSKGYADLRIVPSLGPARVGFDEFTPLFERDGLQLTGSGLAGNNATWGDEAVVSGVAGRASLSAGQFHYQSDGFRSNNQLQHDIYNIFGQVAPIEELSLQAEYRYRDSDEGDLSLLFDPEVFSSTFERKIEDRTGRVGLAFTPQPYATTLLSYIHDDRDERVSGIGNEAVSARDKVDTSTDDFQAQQVLTGDRVSLVLGGGLARIEGHGQQETRLNPDILPCGPFPLPFPCEQVVESGGTDHQHNVYAYSDLRLIPGLLLTLAASYDSFDGELYDKSRLDPKIGARWELLPGWQLRAAYIKSLKRALVLDQTLEPTQVAGFNQLYDDFNGTKVDLYGLGLDGRLGRDLWLGLEAVRRDLDVPVVVTDTITQTVRGDLRNWRDETYRAYLYWTPHERWAASLEYAFEQFRREQDPDPTQVSSEPRHVDTHAVPLTVGYFDPSGLFGQLRGTYIYQDVERDQGVAEPEGHNHGFVVDAAIGYRLPQRRGIVTLEGLNLLDESFEYQDDNFRSSQTRTTRYLPERTVLLRATFTF